MVGSSSENAWFKSHMAPKTTTKNQRQERVATYRTGLWWAVYTLLVYQCGVLSSCGRRLKFEGWFDNNCGKKDGMIDMETPSTSSPQAPEPVIAQGPVIDLLSIGSKGRLDLMEAQKQSFGSHTSVRHFFTTTESDDSDPHCSTELSDLELGSIVEFCKAKKPGAKPVLAYLRNYFASKPWLQKKANPAGWMCAQRRPIHGMYKAFQQYKAGEPLPDKLIVFDDDTYFNLQQLQTLYEDNTPELPLVRAGCLVRSPIHQLNFTFAFGGYGLVFNRQALQKLMTPIHCPRDSDLCARIHQAEVGEDKVFQDGMSVVDLMQAHAANQPYRDLAKGLWTNGYCLHSDWALGYFINFYNITRKSSDPYFESVANDRLEYWLGSGIYRKSEGNCLNDSVEHCHADSLVCHYMTPEAMFKKTEAVRRIYPDQFKKRLPTSDGLQQKNNN